MGRAIRLGWIPRSRAPNTLYPINAFVSIGEKIYQSTEGGVSGGALGMETKHDGVYYKDNGVMWKLVMTGRSVSARQEGTPYLDSAGLIPPYFVWGIIAKYID